MSLYYNTDNYELKELDDTIVEQWRLNNNPKYYYYILAPVKPSDNAVWHNGSWIVPPVTIPQTVSARQVRLWLIRNGFSLTQVYAAIDDVQDTPIRESVRVEWEYAPYIERNHPMLIPLAQSLGLSKADIDRTFIKASSL